MKWNLRDAHLRLERTWGTPILLSNGYQGLFPGGKAAGARCLPLTSI